MSKSSYKSYEKMLRDFLSGKAEFVTEEEMVKGIQQGIVEEISILRIRPTANGYIIISDNSNQKRGIKI